MHSEMFDQITFSVQMSCYNDHIEMVSRQCVFSDAEPNYLFAWKFCYKYYIDMVSLYYVS